MIATRGNPIDSMRRTLRCRREELGLSRAAVVDRIYSIDPDPGISERTIQWLENECQRMPAAELLRPVTEALELDWEEVLRVAGY